MTGVCIQCNVEMLKEKTPVQIVQEDKLIRFELVTALVCEKCGKRYFDPEEWRKLIIPLDAVKMTGLQCS